MNLAFWLSLVLAASSCFGLILAGRGKWQGWAVGLATQPVWAWFAIVTKSWGLLGVGAMYTTVYIKNLLKWRKTAKQWKKETTFHLKPIVLGESEVQIEWDIDANLPMYTRDYLKWLKERPFEYNGSPSTINLLAKDFEVWKAANPTLGPKQA